MSHQSKYVSFNETNRCILRLAYPRGILGYSVQYRLDIGRRAGNDTQDFTRRRLLLQRLLEFLEQPDVLDRDHCLASESFEKFNVFLRKDALPCV